MKKIYNTNNKRMLISLAALFITAFLLFFFLNNFHRLGLTKSKKNPEPPVMDIVKTVDKTEVRFLPTKEIKPFSVINKNQIAEVIGIENKWVKIRVSNITGYVNKESIESLKVKKIKVLKNTAMYSRLNSDNIIYLISEGSVLELINKGEGWVNIKYKGRIGWILTNEYVELSD